MWNNLTACQALRKPSLANRHTTQFVRKEISMSKTEYQSVSGLFESHTYQDIIGILNSHEIWEIRDLIGKTERELLEIPGIGKYQLGIIIAVLKEKRLYLRDAEANYKELFKEVKDLKEELYDIRKLIIHLPEAINNKF